MINAAPILKQAGETEKLSVAQRELVMILYGLTVSQKAHRWNTGDKNDRPRYMTQNAICTHYALDFIPSSARFMNPDNTSFTRGPKI